jgi:hypothetical protein
MESSGLEGFNVQLTQSIACGNAGSQQRRPPTHPKSSDALQESQQVDDSLKDANKLIAELDSAPPLPPRPAKSGTPQGSVGMNGALPAHGQSMEHMPPADLMSPQLSQQLSNPMSSVSDLSNPGTLLLP